MTLGGAGRVDVDRNQCFRRIDDDAAARWQFYRVLKRCLNLAFNLVSAEQWNRIAVCIQFRRIVRHDLRDKCRGFSIGGVTFNQHLANISPKIVSDGSQYRAVFLVQQGRSGLIVFGGLNGLPDLQQIVQIPIQFFGASTDTGGSNDNAHAFRNFHLRHGATQLISLFAFNATRDSASPGVVRHQHHVSTG